MDTEAINFEIKINANYCVKNIQSNLHFNLRVSVKKLK